jgi:hypothetical protein
MKENLAVAIAFAVALYTLILIGMIANNVLIMKDDIKEIKQNINYLDRIK